jgi:leucyl aminopeptidase (aminopeptidase T)
MINKNETLQWAMNIVRTCMGLQRGEKFLLVVDEPLSHAREAILNEATKVELAELWSYTFPNASRPFSEYPPQLVSLMTKMDAIVLLLSTMDMVNEFPAWTAAKTVVMKSEARAGWGAFIDQSILDNEMSADYEQVAMLTSSLAERLRGSSTAHVTTEIGTDLHMSLAGREWREDTGKLRGQGVFGNLPAGEIYIAPIEDSAEGVLIIDKCLPGLLLPEPVKLFFEQGRVTKVEGGAGADYLDKAFKQHGAPARVIAELGIGTNPMARLQGNIITDEKVFGTIHVAVGRSDFIGGKNVATTHIDGVVGKPTLAIDGEILIFEGEHIKDTG